MITIKTIILLRWQSEPSKTLFSTTIDLSFDTKELEKLLLEVAFKIADLLGTCPLEFEFVINNEVFYIISDIDGDEWSISK